MEKKKVKEKINNEIKKKAEAELWYAEPEDHHLTNVPNTNGTVFLDERGSLYTLENDLVGITGFRKLIKHNKGKSIFNFVD